MGSSKTDQGWRACLAVFLPAFLSYFALLRARLNSRVVVGSIERLSPEFDKLVPPDAKLEVITDGFAWAEGPLWVTEDDRGYLVFSDVKKNRIWKWEEGGGLFTIGKSLLLDKSGCRSDATWCKGLVEPGSNGLASDPQGEALLVMCEHGERRVSRMEKNGSFVPLATHYEGKRFNSPNDLVFSPWGDLYFTDPPYGLNEKEEDPARELEISAVYRVPAASLAKQTTFSSMGALDVQAIYTGLVRDIGHAGATHSFRPNNFIVEARPAALMVGGGISVARYVMLDLKRPNGLAFSPDFRHLYVANSDADNPLWLDLSLDEDGVVVDSQVFLSATPYRKDPTRIGNPDGLTVSDTGHLFATGPGGVLVFSPQGEHLGTLLTGKKTANVAIGGDGYLYITASDAIMRVRVAVKPAPFPKMT